MHVDPDRITQVLTNLLGNALLATPAGGTVTVTARPTARGGEVVVTDTGVGLSEQDVERVFERFYRAPGQPRRSAGSGIGLTIARGIARGHGGDVTAASAGPGRGASFTLAAAVALTPPVRYRRARRQLTATPLWTVPPFERGCGRRTRMAGTRSGVGGSRRPDRCQRRGLHPEATRVDPVARQEVPAR